MYRKWETSGLCPQICPPEPPFKSLSGCGFAGSSCCSRSFLQQITHGQCTSACRALLLVLRSPSCAPTHQISPPMTSDAHGITV